MGIELCLFLFGEHIGLVVCPSALNPFHQFLFEEVEFVSTLAVWDASLRCEGVHRGAFLANELTGFFHRHHLGIILGWGCTVGILLLVKAANHIVHLGQQFADCLGQLVEREIISYVIHVNFSFLFNVNIINEQVFLRDVLLQKWHFLWHLPSTKCARMRHVSVH